MAFRAWAFWRRMQYAAGSILAVAFIGVSMYALFFTAPPSCFDLKENGTERGIDCGGACVRICAADVTAPIVLWTRSFKVLDSQYNAVAYVENKNQVAAAPEIRYTFSLHDEQGLITERTGTTILPPNSIYPIFEQRIDTGNRVPTQTFIKLEPVELWQPAERGRNQFRVISREIQGADVLPRLEAKIENTALTEARDVEIVATIFDVTGNALTSSRTFIERFAPRSEQNLVFTWPEPIATTVRSCEVPSDIVVMLDRSGSMAADGGDPPEPLESAKRAAQAFVQQLNANDQVAILSYATEPTNPMEQVLTGNKTEAMQAIAGTVMGTNGTQYTNMGAAFNIAATELLSPRHRDSARKVIILLTDGDVTRPLNPQGERDVEYAAQFARDAATAAKEHDILLYTIGFGAGFKSGDGTISRDVELIRELATDQEKYFEAPTIEALMMAYQQIATDICEDGIAVIDIVPKSATSFTPLR